MSLTEATMKAMLQSIADNIQKVHKDCTAIGNAAAAIRISTCRRPMRK